MEEADTSVKSEESEHRDWWAAFNDPALTRLIDLAYQQNLTVQATGVRVLEARADWVWQSENSTLSNSKPALR